MSRWLKVFLSALIVTAAALAAAPWWLSAALRPVLRAQGITFKNYERNGYARFTLYDAVYRRAGLHIESGAVNAPTPLVWLWQRTTKSGPILRAARWKLTRTAERSPPSPNSKRIRGVPDLLVAVEKVVPIVSYWLPRAELSEGELLGLGPRMSVARARWEQSTLTIDGLELSGRKLAAVLAADSKGSVTLNANTSENDARLDLAWRGAQITGVASLWDQPLQLVARFPVEGWLPEEASALADSWQLPAARAKLGVPYAHVRGDARLIWRNGAFEASLHGEAEPEAGTRKAPPFAVRAASHGTLRELTLTALDVNTPFATAKLTAPVSFSLDKPIANASARLVVKADLAKLPWIEARGQADGTVTVTGDTVAARQDFGLTFRDVAVGGFVLKHAEARGSLAWPKLELTELKIQMDEASALEARGSVDWRTREFNDVTLRATPGSEWLARWLPAGTTWKSSEITAALEGPLTRPRHHGIVRLRDAQLPPLRPVTIEASWEEKDAQTEIEARATAEDSTLELAGTLHARGVNLTALVLRPDGAEGLNLVAPAKLTWSPVWQVDRVQLRGPDSELLATGKGGTDGRFEITATHFPSAWLQDWVKVAGPAWRVNNWHATGQRKDEALEFDTTLAAEIEMNPKPAEVRLAAQGDASGIDLKELTVSSASRILTQASGRLPLVWLVEPKPHLFVNQTAPLELVASTEADSPLWATLSGATGIELTSATARAKVSGSLREPVGELRLAVARMNFAPGKRSFSPPELTDLDLALRFDRGQVTLSAFQAKLDGQAVKADGRMPMNDDRWQQVWRAPKEIDWRVIEARVDIPDADLAPLARRFPNFIAAQGRLHTRLELTPGGKFTGALRLEDAASRPLPAIGTLKEINADLALNDRVVSVRSLTATLGGEPVRMEGDVTLDPDGTPRFALGLQGKNLPLVRSTGLLLRTDLDLRADSTGTGPARLSGTITVRDCLVLANVNLRDLLPSGRRGVSRQPPYFSVAAEPFNRWPLAVAVRARSSIRLRTTVYNGVASASFQLGGTLGEPRAVGELTVDQGQVLFPFATFAVQQGAVRLREADPFHAVISLNAVAQRRDHQLRLEVTGELPSPNVVLSSTPAMESGDVLLMVMTGQPPPGDTLASTAAGPRLAMLGAYLGRGLFQDLGFGGEDRLEITSGEQISREGRETYEFEYKLGGRWSLQGEYDEFDSYNAGLKWRAYTEESVPHEKK
jgi:translocation and assembly module TamB